MSEKEMDLASLSSDIVQFLRRNWIVLGVCGLIGLALGYWSYSKTNTSYQSETIIQSSIVPAPVLVNQLNDIGNLVANQQYADLAKKLDWTEASAENIQAIGLISIYDRDVQHYVLKIEVANNILLIDSCINRIANYLSTNEYVSNELAFKQASLQNEEVAIQQQIEILTGIQQKMIDGESNAIYADPASLSKQILMLQNEKLLLSNRLNNLDVLEIIDTGVVVNPPSLLRSLASSVIVMLALGMFFLGLLGFIKLGTKN